MGRAQRASQHAQCSFPSHVGCTWALRLASGRLGGVSGILLTYGRSQHASSCQWQQLGTYAGLSGLQCCGVFCWPGRHAIQLSQALPALEALQAARATPSLTLRWPNSKQGWTSWASAPPRAWKLMQEHHWQNSGVLNCILMPGAQVRKPVTPARGVVACRPALTAAVASRANNCGLPSTCRRTLAMG